MRTLVVAAFIFSTATFAHADFRSESINAVSALRDAGIAKKMPDEMLSIDATFLAAEQYLQLNDLQNADRYYLLTLQKARLVASLLLNRQIEASIPANEEPRDDQQPSAPSVNQVQTAEPLPAPTPQTTPDIQSENPATVQPPTGQRFETTAPTSAEQSTPEAETDFLPDNVPSDKLVGRHNVYIVRKNDYLRLVAAKLGVSRQHLVQANHLDPKAFLKIGQKLKYNNRKIVPRRMKNGIVINIPDRTLYYFRQGKLTASMPVALGAAKKTDKYDWKTPTGKFRITAKQIDPTWYVPFSIRSEMEDDGKEVVTTVPPGSSNPLGKYAIKTSLPGILIHSTTKPGSIYSFASHGCIRVYPEHMEGLFKEIKINTLGEIIYRPVKLAVTEQGRIFMEVHKDEYGKSMGLDAEAKRLIKKHNLSDRVNWRKVDSVVRNKAGLAEDVTL